MPSNRRKPITYTPQYSDAIFRPRAVVEGELAALDPERTADQLTPDGASPSTTGADVSAPGDHPAIRDNERTNERTDTYPDETQPGPHRNRANGKAAARPAGRRAPTGPSSRSTRSDVSATEGAPPRSDAGLPGRSSEQTDDASNERTVERTNGRLRVRHSFDVFADQLLALTEIQAEQYRKTGHKPKMGELVQTAIDAYIARRRRRAGVTEQTVE